MSAGLSQKGFERLVNRLHLLPEQAKRLYAAMAAGDAAVPAVVLTPQAGADYEPPFPCLSPGIPWLPARVRLPVDGVKVTSYADYERGCYYALDLSSCWAWSAISATFAPPKCSIDLCAAPGGKTVLSAAHFPRCVHTANEVHAGRRGILRQNLIRCGLHDVRISGLRADQWSTQGMRFDLLLVDAPCSGQSLLCKGLSNPGCLSARIISGNAKRQRGILLCALRCAAPGAFLLYTTCTYDPEENERVVAYILRREPGWSAVAVPALTEFRSALSAFPSYRLLPYCGYGAGGFCCLLHNDGARDEPTCVGQNTSA